MSLKNMCSRCNGKSKNGRLVIIDNCQALLCSSCKSDFDEIKSFYSIPDHEQFAAFQMFCQRGIVVKYQDTESLEHEEAQNACVRSYD